MHLILIRHARSTANVAGVLAGRAEGVHLDEMGMKQAEEVPSRLRGVEVDSVVGSPLTRCRETAEPLVFERKIAYHVDERLNEVDYGDWSGGRLEELSKDPLWDEIQRRPSSVTFPNGESMTSLFTRAADFVEDVRKSDHETIVAFTHGDVAKAIISHCLAAPRDEFQRIVVAPASFAVISLQPERTFVLRTNDGVGSLSEMVKRKEKDAAVGGGA